MASQTNDNQHTQKTTKQDVDRAQWLRAAILGANDGLLSTTSLMLGVGAAVDDNRRSMILSGLAGALAGACSMAVGEFVSVSTQRDIEKRVLLDELKLHDEENSRVATTPGRSPMMKVIADDLQAGSKSLPSPHKAAAASAVAFMSGAVIPLVVSAFVVDSIVRVGMIVVVATLALAAFGGAGARLGGSPVKASAARVVVGGLLAMAVTYGLLKPFDRSDQEKK